MKQRHAREDRAANLFDLTGRVAVITGGTGLLGRRHADVLAAAGAHVAILDLPCSDCAGAATDLTDRHAVDCMGIATDITITGEIEQARTQIMKRFGRVDILINNAANNAQIGSSANGNPSERISSRLEHILIESWEADLRVGLTGAFLCSRIFGAEMVKSGRGVIVNVASDLALIAPDHRLYRIEGLNRDEQPVKSVTYSVVKSGILGLTRYLAVYWAEDGVRVNSISPGGVLNGQSDEFVQRINRLIPLGRMARHDEYQGAILFLCSDASSYMTGSNLVIDGGRTCL
jgi:NAD(P)-dependent dehydrogenase (short-subunit alcohol dehydrogenase family)